MFVKQSNCTLVQWKLWYGTISNLKLIDIEIDSNYISLYFCMIKLGAVLPKKCKKLYPVKVSNRCFRTKLTYMHCLHIW